MASPTQWTWVWASSGSWWWTGKPGHAAVYGVTKSRRRLNDWTELREREIAHSYLIPWTVAYQAPPSIGFFRQKYWSGVPLKRRLTEKQKGGHDSFKIMSIGKNTFFPHYPWRIDSWTHHRHQNPQMLKYHNWHYISSICHLLQPIRLCSIVVFIEKNLCMYVQTQTVQTHAVQRSTIFRMKWNIDRKAESLRSPLTLNSAQLSHSVMSDSLRPHEPQHARPPCPSPTRRVHPNSCPLSWWCHPSISSSAIPFSSRPQSFPASGSFQMSQLFASGGQSIGVSASTSVLPMKTED